jgi:hypothetical protein
MHILKHVESLIESHEESHEECLIKNYKENHEECLIELYLMLNKNQIWILNIKQFEAW